MLQSPNIPCKSCRLTPGWLRSIQRTRYKTRWRQRWAAAGGTIGYCSQRMCTDHQCWPEVRHRQRWRQCWVAMFFFELMIVNESLCHSLLRRDVCTHIACGICRKISTLRWYNETIAHHNQNKQFEHTPIHWLLLNRSIPSIATWAR